MPSKCIPNHLYSAGLIGHDALMSVLAGSPLDISSSRRSSFLDDQMKATATLPHSVYQAGVITSVSAAQRYQYIRRLAIVPGFCYVRLFKPEWVIPALYTLGPFPLNIDVAALKPYFHAEGKVITRSGSRQGC